MRKYSLLFCLVSSLAVTLAPACGDDDDDGDDDAPAVDADTTTPDAAAGTPDAPAVSPITDEYLDESCSAQTDCGGLLEPDGSGDYNCLVLDAADTLGICASKCTENTDCMDNFTPPAGSSTACALTVAPDNYCAIVCATPGSVTECPTGFTCTALEGLNICYADQPGG
jgi:hypothetical protein